jgi:hypothetical protein
MMSLTFMIIDQKTPLSTPFLEERAWRREDEQRQQAFPGGIVAAIP